MKKLTLEDAHDLLVKLDPSMPAKFTVLAVAYAGVVDTYYVKWFDEADKETYDDGVAQMKVSGAKAAYSYTPRPAYSAIWFNESENGVEAPVASVLEPADISQLRKNEDKLTLLDSV